MAAGERHHVLEPGAARYAGAAASGARRARDRRRRRSPCRQRLASPRRRVAGGGSFLRRRPRHRGEPAQQPPRASAGRPRNASRTSTISAAASGRGASRTSSQALQQHLPGAGQDRHRQLLRETAGRASALPASGLRCAASGTSFRRVTRCTNSARSARICDGSAPSRMQLLQDAQRLGRSRRA